MEGPRQNSSVQFRIFCLLLIQLLLAIAITASIYWVRTPSIVKDVHNLVCSLENKNATRKQVRSLVQQKLGDEALNVKQVSVGLTNYDLINLPQGFDLVVYYSVSDCDDSSELLSCILLGKNEKLFGDRARRAQWNSE